MRTIRATPVAARSPASRRTTGLGRLLDLVLPASCAGCQRPQRPGLALCPACAGLLGEPKLVGHGRPDLPPVFGLGAYAGPLRTALLSYKERGRRELAGPFGAALAAAVLALAEDLPRPADGWWLVPAPSRPGQARRRGGEHVHRLATTAAAELAAAGSTVTVAPAVRLAGGVRDSVGLDRAGRAANLAGRVLPDLAGLPPPGTRVLLVDDVFTTGATAAACVSALAAVALRTSAVLTLCVTKTTGSYHSSGLLRSQPDKYRRRLNTPENADRGLFGAPASRVSRREEQSMAVAPEGR